MERYVPTPEASGWQARRDASRQRLLAGAGLGLGISITGLAVVALTETGDVARLAQLAVAAPGAIYALWWVLLSGAWGREVAASVPIGPDDPDGGSRFRIESYFDGADANARPGRPRPGTVGNDVRAEYRTSLRQIDRTVAAKLRPRFRQAV